ncbi:hypothetical protein [Treponema medium]|uniref:hypothetical protein n=1 Tax=Treponema medium TaxID=58231 RepID=UPI00198214D1|nr:hypothetical protein [Treponema medium]
MYLDDDVGLLPFALGQPVKSSTKNAAMMSAAAPLKVCAFFFGSQFCHIDLLSF